MEISKQLEIAYKWVEDLRSGGFNQATEAWIRKSETDGTIGYCCLGVLAERCGIPLKDKVERETRDFDIAGYSSSISWLKKYKMSVPDFFINSEMEYIVMPILISDEEWKSMKLPNISKKRSILYILADLNDTGVNFETIAIVIEKSIIPWLENKKYESNSN